MNDRVGSRRRFHRIVLALAGSAASSALAAAARPARAASPAEPAEPGDAPALTGIWTHAYAPYGQPKYARDYDHFDFVRPDAPKRGTLYLRNPDRRTSFDKYNPFTTRGVAPAGLVIYMFESLTTVSGDDPQTVYGLVAESFQVAADKSSVTFRLHPKARFYNGDPVTAADVKYSFEAVSGKQASPAFQTAYAGVERAVIVDPRTIRFDLRERSSDAVLAAAGTPVFSPKWALGPDGQPKPLDQIVDQRPITTGPYLIDVVERPRRIEFRRNPDYWARDLPVRRGWFNFDRVVYRLYADNDVAREAFKAGEFDFYKEYSARSWVRLHKGPKWDAGLIRKDPFETRFGQGLQSYQLNTRLPKFHDIRTREALTWTYDFTASVNRYGQYKRANSLFNNSDFAARGTPSAAELALLEPFRAEVPAAVFGPAYVAPATDGDPARLRRNLLRARELFEAAGWRLAADGRLRNVRGEAFEVELLLAGDRGGSMPEWRLNLEKLGARLTLRSVDFALFRQRLEQYDFEMVVIAGGQFTLPSASELLTSCGSKSADEKGNNHFRGIRSRAVDHVLDRLAGATTLQQLQDACRALDRLVMWGHYQVPDLWIAAERASYWDRFGQPPVRPKYYTVESPNDAEPQWPITTWWIRDGAVR